MSKEELIEAGLEVAKKAGEGVVATAEGTLEKSGEVMGKATDAFDKNNLKIESTAISGANEADTETIKAATGEADEDVEKLKQKRTEQLRTLEMVDDPYTAWMKREYAKIDEKDTQMQGQMVQTAIAGKTVAAYDRLAATLTLENNSQINFIKHAGMEGTEEEVNYALKIVDTLYKDRDDFRADLYAQKGDFAKAEEYIVNNKNPDLEHLMTYSARNLEKKNPGSTDRILEKVKTLNPDYYKMLEGEMKHTG